MVLLGWVTWFLLIGAIGLLFLVLVKINTKPQELTGGYASNFPSTFSLWLPHSQEDASNDGAISDLSSLSMGTAALDSSQDEINLRVFTGTWNMGDCAPNYKTLRAWFTSGQPSSTTGDLPYDILAIATQECSYKPRLGFQTCEKDWANAVSEAIGPRFELVSASSLRDSIRLLLFVRKRWIDCMHSIHSSTYSTTVPMFWRKGGIGVQMSFINTTFCFIAVHLAAHATETMNRNLDITSILKTLNLGNPNYDVGHQFHHCFFMGDMNYRVDLKDWPRVSELIQTNQFAEIIPFDQLKKEQAEGRILYGFLEPPITFAPTFKVKRGTRDVYDPRRIPSWCDRVLVHSLPGCKIKSLSYTSVDSLLTSDHVPVAASFQIGIPHIKVSYRDEQALRQFLVQTSRHTNPFLTTSPPISPSPPVNAPLMSLATSQHIPSRPKPVPRSAMRLSTSVGSNLDTYSISQPEPDKSEALQTTGYRSVTPCTYTSTITMDQLSASTEIVDADADLFELTLSQVSVILTPLASTPALLRHNQVYGMPGDQPPTPRIVLSSPILQLEPIKSDPIPPTYSPYLWDSIPPALTKPVTKAALCHYHLFISVYHYVSPTTEKRLAHAVLHLKDFIDRTAPFDLPLLYCGVQRGTISGSLSVQ